MLKLLGTAKYCYSCLHLAKLGLLSCNLNTGLVFLYSFLSEKEENSMKHGPSRYVPVHLKPTCMLVLCISPSESWSALCSCYSQEILRAVQLPFIGDIDSCI